MTKSRDTNYTGEDIDIQTLDKLNIITKCKNIKIPKMAGTVIRYFRRPRLCMTLKL